MRRQKALYTVRKVQHMNCFGIPAKLNPRTGAARPDWKEEDDKQEAKRLAMTSGTRAFGSNTYVG